MDRDDLHPVKRAPRRGTSRRDPWARLDRAVIRVAKVLTGVIGIGVGLMIALGEDIFTGLMVIGATLYVLGVFTPTRRRRFDDDES